MRNRTVGAFIQKSAAHFAAGALIILGTISQSLNAAPAARPIISGGTIKTPDGQLLRGCHAHILRNLTSAQTLFFTNRANVQKLKDQAHMNLIRICFVTPSWGGNASPDVDIPIADSIIANCESVGGVYAIINLHGPIVMDGSAWDINKFWNTMSLRYKDRTCVLYGQVNELWQNPGNYVDQWVSDLYKTMRKNAPNTMIMGVNEPVNMTANWGAFCRDYLGPACGIDWANGGKDAFSWHAYGGDPQYVLQTKALVPTMCSEFSFWEEGWWSNEWDGCHMFAQWCEKNGLSWCVWQDRKPVDQLASVMNYLIPDAIAKKYAWWTNTETQTPRTPANLHSRPCAAAGSQTVLANGQVVRSQAGKTRLNQLSMWRKIIKPALR